MIHIITLHEIHSTNSYIKDLLQEGAIAEGLIISAESQTAGRGQRGNSWEAKAGKNLTFSMVLCPKHIKVQEQFIISQLVSLAIQEVMSKYTPDISIKWPNDIYYQEKKIAGILIENILDGNEIAYSIAGIGLNINQAEFISNAPNPVSLFQIIGREENKEDILQEIGELIFFYYQNLDTEKENIIKRYKENLFRKEGFHRYEDKDGQFEARIADVSSDGFLQLETREGEIKFFAFKEVKYVL